MLFALLFSATTVAGQTTTVAPLTYADSCLLFEVNCNSTTADLTLNTTCFNEIDRAFGTDLTGLNIAKTKGTVTTLGKALIFP